MRKTVRRILKILDRLWFMAMCNCISAIVFGLAFNILGISADLAWIVAFPIGVVAGIVAGLLCIYRYRGEEWFTWVVARLLLGW